MAEMLRCISPVDGSLYAELPLATPAELDATLQRAADALPRWRAVPLAERLGIVERAVQWFEANSAAIAEEITLQMGRPLRYTPGEIRGLAERARYMASIAPEVLADLDVGAKEGFHRFIRREPLGVVLALAPWNYPFLTAVNTIVPALLAGNTVVLKHSDQTPLAAERFAAAFAAAGLPAGVFQRIHMTHDLTGAAVRDPRVAFVAFTGSVVGGQAVNVHAALGGRFTPVGLELGGKDPAYVRPDADLAFAIENTVDGAFFNSGQSCCAIERIYVHRDIYEEFVDGFADLTRQYVLGDPRDSDTTLGPVVRATNAAAIQAQIDDALRQGARALIDVEQFSARNLGPAYMAPQVLVDVRQDMAVMQEETFGPVVGILPVASDEEAINLMNDSAYGLTASVWTRDEAAALRVGDRLQTGTVFANRCDYLDPALAWVGVKNSGRGCTLSRLGYDQLTRPKSFHLRIR